MSAAPDRYAGLGHPVQRSQSPFRGVDLMLTASASASASKLQGAAVPVADRVLHNGTLAVNMMYGAAAPALLLWARRRGFTARDGLRMLVEQAAEAFLGRRGTRPGTAPVLAALRARRVAAA